MRSLPQSNINNSPYMIKNWNGTFNDESVTDPATFDQVLTPDLNKSEQEKSIL